MKKMISFFLLVGLMCLGVGVWADDDWTDDGSNLRAKAGRMVIIGANTGTTVGSYKLHVTDGSQIISHSSWYAAGAMAFERNGAAYLTFGTPNNQPGGIAFQDSDGHIATSDYDHNNNKFRWSVYGTGLTDMVLNSTGLGLGVNPSEKLTVDGKIVCEEVKVQAVNPPDYVFEKDYQLRPLEEVESFIQKKKHLPGIPSAAEQKKQKHIGVSNMMGKHLEKIEELTLYMIEMKKVNTALQKQNQELQKRLERLEKKLSN